MLDLKNVKKYYFIGNTITRALDGVSISFRKREFVSILGASGSGKTTMLNVIGGLDTYDSGNMIVNGKSTDTFKDSDWDAYRNNSIGFVFQSYNLISHLGIIENVELGMTLSGVSKEEKRKSAIQALERVGLKDHLKKKPNQLSGGQMQRVAIARAIVNNPDILLCDEPTGALDTETSIQIMKLIKELSKEQLVIMVTHNPELAYEYSDRIVEFSDGKIKKDTNPHEESAKKDEFQLKRTKMSFLSAVTLSFNNLKSKKGRTFLTAFASSIGIISIGIVLALSNGFKTQIDQTQVETLAQFPVTISQSVPEQPENSDDTLGNNKGEFSTDSEITAKLSNQEQSQHINKINEEYIEYVENIDPKLSDSIGYTELVNMNLLSKIDDEIIPVRLSNANPDLNGSLSSGGMGNSGLSSYPKKTNPDSKSFLEENYDILSGEYPKRSTDIVLIVDRNNSTDINALKNIGIEISPDDKISFDSIVGKELKLISNDVYYKKLPEGNFAPNNDLNEMYNDENNTTLRVSGIVRIKSSSSMDLLSPGFAYSSELTSEIVSKNGGSEIVQEQKKSNLNVLTNEPIDEVAKESNITYLGGNSIPSSIMIFPSNYENKEKILSYLDKYNSGKKKSDKIIYTDMASTMTELTGGLMDAVTYVLVAFAGISLVTSMIMISIITYTSVIERTKEIGILKALGARKKDVTRVFDAETFILGIASGTLGVLIAWLLTFPINSLLLDLTNLENVAHLDPVAAILLVSVSTVLTMIGGHIPAKMASKKDPVSALRSE